MTIEETQLSLEREMTHYGEKRFYDKLLEASQSGRESTNPASIALMKGAIEPVALAIDEELSKLYDKKTHIHKRLFGKLAETNSKTVAYLSLKALLDCVSRGEALSSMAIKIARYIEDELRLKEYMQQNKPLIDKVKKNVTKRTSNYKHKRNVIIHSASKAGLKYKNWTTDYQLALGIRLIDIIISSTNLFEINSRKASRGRVSKHVVPTKKTLGWMIQRHDFMSILRPLRLPMVVKPKPWVSLTEGGYLSVESDFVRFNSPLVKNDYISMSKESGINFNQVFDVVNAVQETPWRINKKVLKVIEHFWFDVKEDVLGCLPLKNEIVGPPFPKGETDKEVIKKWKMVSSQIYSENIRGMSHKLAFTKILWVADKFRDNTLYFPHNVDFRGRVYPIPDFLNPQGDDSCKGLLQFANGKPITTESGKKHFLMYGASLYGHDKWSDYNKLDWVKKNETKILWATEDTMGQGDIWKDADKPWQFLAWCFEYYRWFENRGAVIYLPIMVDGTCNGLQHLSALMKDEVGGEAVNLVDTGDTPNDIYQIVSDKCNETYKGSVKIDRKLTKRPVMTTPYGSTIYGMREQIKEELRKRSDRILISNEWDNWEDVVEVSEVIYDAIGKIVVKSREFMNWLQDIAEVMAGNNKPMEWKTPFGFYVYQTYYNTKQRRINTHLSGKLKGYRPSVRETIVNSQDVQKNKNAIAPNFIHSLDAAHLMFTINDLRYSKHDIKDLFVVHDCFGVHADSVDLLVHTLKDTFIEMYTGNAVVDSFIEDYLKQYLDRVDYFKIVEDRPKTGKLNINDVRESRFFFS